MIGAGIFSILGVVANAPPAAWVALLATLVLSFLIEVVYRRHTGRRLQRLARCAHVVVGRLLAEELLEAGGEVVGAAHRGLGASVVVGLEHGHVRAQLGVAGDRLVVQRAPAIDLLLQVGGQRHGQHVGEVLHERADGERVLGVAQVVGHSDAQRDRRDRPLLQLDVQRADQPGHTLVRRCRQPEALGQVG